MASDMKLKPLWLEKLLDHEHVRHAGILVGGAALGQLIMVAILPILTRIYSPEDFSVLSLYVASLAIVASIACLRLEIAIPLPASEEEGFRLMVLALISAAILSFSLSGTLYFLRDWIASMSYTAEYSQYLWLFPIGMFLTGSYGALQSWSTRRKLFPLIAKTRINQASAGGGVQVGLGLAGYMPVGLLIGHAIYSGAGVGSLVVRNYRDIRRYASCLDWGRLRATFKEYERFPKYSTLEVLANISGIQLPIVIIAFFVIGPEAGFLMLAMRVMQAPMGLIGSSVGQVFLANGAEYRRENKIGEFAASILTGLIKSGIGPLFCAGLLAPEIFSLVFGKEWARAGNIALWITPWLILQFLASPISMIMHIQNEHKKNLALTLFGFLVRVGPVAFAVLFFPSVVVELYAASGAVFYLLCLIVFVYFSGMKFSDLYSIFRRTWKVLGAWLVFGVLAKIGLIWFSDYL